MAEEFEKKFIRPIVNASYPGTLAALSLAVMQVGGRDSPMMIRFVLSLGAIMFLLSAFFIFFYCIYPTRRKLWTGTAMTFLTGLVCSVLSVFLLLIA